MKIFALLTLTLFSFLAQAEPLNIIVNGSPGGTFFERSHMYAEILQKSGYDVNLINAGKTLQAANLFEKINDPTMMVWIDTLSAIRPLEATEENFVSLEYSAPLYLCNKNGKNGGTVGMPKTYVFGPIQQIGKFKPIPYKNTGAVRDAAIAKEIDFAYLNQGKAKTLESAGFSCQTVPGIKQHAIVIAKNIDLGKLAMAVSQAQNNNDFVNWLDKRNFYRQYNISRLEQLDLVLKSQDLWKNAE